jgi:hypothetical protein
LAPIQKNLSIYVLQLEKGKYYVGKTKQIAEARFEQHKQGGKKSSAWTRMYKPIKLLEVYPNANKYDEDKYVLINIEKYGIENVRGGSYSKIELSIEQIIEIQTKIKGASDQCFRCGESGHFIKHCKKVKLFCDRCGRDSHNADKCYAQTNINRKALPCAHCGLNHPTKNCYAKSQLCRG